jgi:hypothetical protein
MKATERNSTGTTSVRLLAHDAALYRRVGWRFEERGLIVSKMTIGEFDTNSLADTDSSATAFLVDLGWSETEIAEAMRVVFALTELSDPLRVVVLAPWFDAATRPEWAELGVSLVLDRTTPPPTIVESVIGR